MSNTQTNLREKFEKRSKKLMEDKEMKLILNETQKQVLKQLTRKLKSIKEITGNGADYVFDIVGSPDTTEKTILSAKEGICGYNEGGTVILVGFPKKAAEFRGGECLSKKMKDMRTKLKWKCAFDHEFEGSPYLILRAGHWCPECVAPPWEYDKIAKENPFLAQAYYLNHDKDENNTYNEECYKDIK